MTLCLAWRNGQNVCFASDSRLSNATGIVSDDATKVFSINVEVYGSGSVSDLHKPASLQYRTTYGLCFAGSYLNGSTFADTIQEVLSSIQAAPGSDISIDNISEVAFSVYKQITRQLTALHRFDGQAEILFGGYCLISGEFKLFWFGPTIVDQMIDYEKKEVRLQDLPFFMGDTPAKDKAIKLVPKLGSDYSYFHILREVIRDNSIRTVGGNIQAGQFKPSRFRTYGILEYSISNNEYGNLEVKDDMNFRGISINLDNIELRRGNLNYLKPLFNPFENEREEYFKQVFRSLGINDENEEQGRQ